MSARPCGTCNKKVYPNEKIAIGSGITLVWYHRPCLKCKTCSTTLSMTTLSSLDGAIYCARHMPKEKPLVVVDSMSLKAVKKVPKIPVVGLLKTKVGIATFKGLTLRAKGIAGPLRAHLGLPQLGIQRGIITEVDPNLTPVNRIDEENEEDGNMSEIDKELAALRVRIEKMKHGQNPDNDDDFDITEEEAEVLAEHFNLPPATIRLEAKKVLAASSRGSISSLQSMFEPPTEDEVKEAEELAVEEAEELAVEEAEELAVEEAEELAVEEAEELAVEEAEELAVEEAEEGVEEEQESSTEVSEVIDKEQVVEEVVEDIEQLQISEPQEPLDEEIVPSTQIEKKEEESIDISDISINEDEVDCWK